MLQRWHHLWHIGTAKFGWIAGFVLLLAVHAIPAGLGQKTIAADRPVALSQISVADGVLTQQRHLARAPLAQDDPADLAAPPRTTLIRSDDLSNLIWAASPTIRNASPAILPPSRGPPVA